MDEMLAGIERDFTLSAEERQMVGLILGGYTNKDMARQFNLSESAVNRRTLRIFDKLGVTNKLELVLFACSRRVADVERSQHPD